MLRYITNTIIFSQIVKGQRERNYSLKKVQLSSINRVIPENQKMILKESTGIQRCEGKSIKVSNRVYLKMRVDGQDRFLSEMNVGEMKYLSRLVRRLRPSDLSGSGGAVRKTDQMSPRRYFAYSLGLFKANKYVVGITIYIYYAFCSTFYLHRYAEIADLRDQFTYGCCCSTENFINAFHFLFGFGQ